MGLFNFIKNQFVELIEWTDTSSQTLVYPIPVMNQSIKMGATLTVRESQVAVIVNEGKVADVFAPGRYTLSQENMPLLSAQKLWKYGFKSPFKADVYYVNTKQITDLKWATVNPLMMKTPEFGDIRLKANGTYAFRVMSTEKFMKEIFGTNQIYDTSYITGQLKSILIAGLSDLLSETHIPLTELASYYDEISDNAENMLQERFAKFGLELCSFIIEHIILPGEVVAAVAGSKVEDEHVSIEAVEALEEVEAIEVEAIEVEAVEEVEAVQAAKIAELGLRVTETENRHELDSQSTQIKCMECGHCVETNMKFCSECGTGVKHERPCSCGYILNGAMKFCPDCGVKV